MNELKAREAAEYIQNSTRIIPKIGLILGSGLGALADEIEQSVRLPYQSIPGFPVSTVTGHVGHLVIGRLEGKPVIAMQGRFHFYEGYPIEKVIFPVHVMSLIGVETLFITNAAGGINKTFSPGDLMVITDHMNNMGFKPFLQAKFYRPSAIYTKQLITLAENVAEKIGLNIKKGVYVANSGPSYETPAEIYMLEKLGGDAVGMSTIPEAITAHQHGMNVLGISCISNMAAGILDQPLNHEEVIETANKVKIDFIRFVKEILRDL